MRENAKNHTKIPSSNFPSRSSHAGLFTFPDGRVPESLVIFLFPLLCCRFLEDELVKMNDIAFFPSFFLPSGFKLHDSLFAHGLLVKQYIYVVHALSANLFPGAPEKSSSSHVFCAKCSAPQISVCCWCILRRRRFSSTLSAFAAHKIVLPVTERLLCCHHVQLRFLVISSIPLPTENTRTTVPVNKLKTRFILLESRIDSCSDWPSQPYACQSSTHP